MLGYLLTTKCKLLMYSFWVNLTIFYLLSCPNFAESELYREEKLNIGEYCSVKEQQTKKSKIQCVLSCQNKKSIASFLPPNKCHCITLHPCKDEEERLPKV